MGAHPYFYFAQYHADIEITLEILRQQEFIEGRYNSVIKFVDCPITTNSPSPGANHSSIEEALKTADTQGTRSILDISKISQITYEEASNLLELTGLLHTSFPLSNNKLIELFNTHKPTYRKIEKVIILEEENQEIADEFWENIDRGTARHIVVYDKDKPAKVFFAGYSFD